MRHSKALISSSGQEVFTKRPHSVIHTQITLGTHYTHNKHTHKQNKLSRLMSAPNRIYTIQLKTNNNTWPPSNPYPQIRGEGAIGKSM